MTCSQTSFKGKYPDILFCVDETNGDIYNTNLIKKHARYSEVFKLSIAVQTKPDAYPHRDFKVSLNIFVGSVCNAAYSMTRLMSIAGCQAQCAYIGHFQPVVKRNSLESSYDVIISMSRGLKPHCTNNDPTQPFLVAMMIKTKWPRPPSPSEAGNYVRFVLRSKHQKVEAFYYLRNAQVSFENTFVHQTGVKYKLSAYKYNYKLNKEKPHKFDWALWGVYLIPMDNYCALQPKCRPLFEEYYKYTRAPDYNTICGDLDIEGYKAMYGKCKRKYQTRAYANHFRLAHAQIESNFVMTQTLLRFLLILVEKALRRSVFLTYLHFECRFNQNLTPE